MKSVSLPQIKMTRLSLFSFFSIISLIFSLVLVCQIGEASQARLSLADILIGLRSKKVTLVERNKLLADAVKVRGITFAMTPEIEKELANTGADKDLIEAIRQKSPVVRVIAATTPKPEATPLPSPPAPDFTFYQKRADAHIIKGEYDLALVNYNKVIELNSADAATYRNRGLAYSNKKSYDQAIADYDKAIELNPKESLAYLNRGESYEKMGNAQKALADYQKAVELDAGNEAAKTSVQRIQAEQAKLTPTPPTKVATLTPTEPVDRPTTVNFGALNSLATKLAMPVYSSIDRNRNIQGIVTVQITLDEEGKVVSAKATDGPRLLRANSEEAARRSKFKPARIGEQPVKATGFINYNFTAKANE